MSLKNKYKIPFYNKTVNVMEDRYNISLLNLILEIIGLYVPVQLLAGSIKY